MTGSARSFAVVEFSNGEHHRSGMLPVFTSRCGFIGWHAVHLPHFSNATLTVGKYLISPLIRTADCGSYRASVSIKSGRGSGTHDRVLRLIGLFRTAETAHRYALSEGIDYIRPRFVAGVLPLCTQGAE